MTNQLGARVLTILVILTTLELVLGCHVANHVERRKKRYASDSLDIEGEIGVFFTECLGDITTETWDWRSLVDYVVKYSKWFEEVQLVTCSNDLGLDTPLCWKNQVQKLMQVDSPLIQPIRDCIDGFATFKNLLYISSGGMEVSSFITMEISSSVSMSIASSLESQYARNSPSKIDSNKCPNILNSKYEKCVNDALVASVGYNSFSVTSISSLTSFMEEEGDCKESCECSDVFGGASDVTDWYDRKGISCNDCWATRLAAVTKNSDPVISAVLKNCAYK